jgi:hypothetical protein
MGHELRWDRVRYDAARLGLPEQKMTASAPRPLQVLLVDARNLPLFVHCGGIQLLQRRWRRARIDARKISCCRIREMMPGGGTRTAAFIVGGSRCCM